MPAFCNLFGSFEATAAVVELAEEAGAVAETAAGALLVETFAFGLVYPLGTTLRRLMEAGMCLVFADRPVDNDEEEESASNEATSIASPVSSSSADDEWMLIAGRGHWCFCIGRAGGEAGQRAGVSVICIFGILTFIRELIAPNGLQALTRTHHDVI